MSSTGTTNSAVPSRPSCSWAPPMKAPVSPRNALIGSDQPDSLRMAEIDRPEVRLTISDIAPRLTAKYTNTAREAVGSGHGVQAIERGSTHRLVHNANAAA